MKRKENERANPAQEKGTRLRSGRGARQRVRSAILIVSFLLFPVTMNYFSPYVIVDGAVQGIAAGSLLGFAGLFVSSLVFGRAFCGWLCPGGAFGELCFRITDRPVNRTRLDPVKYVIWAVWLAAILFAFIRAGGILTVDPLHLTDSGVSVDRPMKFIMYYIVIGLFFTFSVLAGRRATCHAFCWMAPFMVLGRKLSNAFRLPALRLRAHPDRCISCGLCDRTCPMSLDVSAMIAAGRTEHTECILCGRCVESCTHRAVSFGFGRPRRPQDRERSRRSGVPSP